MNSYNILCTSCDAQSCGSLTLSGLHEFSPARIFDCGQCFRFDPLDGEPDVIEGVAYGRYIRIRDVGNGAVELLGTSRSDFDEVWANFLSLDEDYDKIREDIAGRFDTALGRKDDVIRAAEEYGSGIRILRQEPWEALISFIISQNNNIPRIKKIISELCVRYGEPIDTQFGQRYAFPKPETILSAGLDGIFALKTGFRAKYIIDAAEKVLSGECDLEALRRSDGLSAINELMKIKGVGPKVASCVSLFGLGHTDAFPVDVWIKRVLEHRYPDGLDYTLLGPYAGIAQQYLFYYERYGSDSFAV